jgi:hypothetical protein
MPLRQPPSQPGPQAAWGRQIYARGVRDATLAVIGPLATSVRHNVQRQVPVPGAAQPRPEPLLVRGLARSASANTPVLPQARVQRAPDEAAPGQATLPLQPATAAAAAAPTGTLPLAPPTPAPAQPEKTPAVARIQAWPATPIAPAVQRLPLAPVIQRAGEEGSSGGSTVSGDDLNQDEQLSRYLKGLRGGPAPTSTANTSDDEERELDELATQLLPYIKRLLEIEKERLDPI